MKRLVFLIFIPLVLGACTESNVPSGADHVPVKTAPAAEANATPEKDPGPAVPLPSLHVDQLKPAEGSLIGVFHSTNGAGALKDCGCNLNPLGGIARRAAWLANHRKGWAHQVLLDGGDLFTDGNPLDLPEGANHQMVLKRGAFLVEAYNQMGYSAFTVGDRDLLLGVKALQTLSSNAKFPFMALNVTPKNGPDFFGKEPHLITLEGVKIALIGVVSASTSNQGAFNQGGEWDVKDPFPVVRDTIKEWKDKADLFWVLGHLKEGEAEILLEEIPEVQAVFGGQDIRSPAQLTWIENRICAQGGEKGKKLYITSIDLLSPESPLNDPTRLTSLRSKSNSLTQKLEERTSALAAATKEEPQGSNIQWLKKNVVKLRTELQQINMEIDEAKETPADAKTNRVVFDIIELRKDLPEENLLKDAVDKLEEKYPSLKKEGSEP